MMDREETHIEDKQPTVRWRDESMALHWIDRYASGVDGEPQMGRILACVEPAAVRSSPTEANRLVPVYALDWLFGEGPDKNGQWFGEVRGSGAFWWRSQFRAMIDASASPTGGEAGAVGEIVSVEGSLGDMHVIKWANGHTPKVGDKLYMGKEVSPELCEECGKFVAPQDAIWTDDGSPHHQTCLPAAPLMDEVEAVLRALLARDERNTCQHEETHRGGFLWEICDQCGAKWADDQGGKPEWSDPPEWVTARALLTKLQEGGR